MGAAIKNVSFYGERLYIAIFMLNLLIFCAKSILILTMCCHVSWPVLLIASNGKGKTDRLFIGAVIDNVIHDRWVCEGRGITETSNFIRGDLA